MAKEPAAKPKTRDVSRFEHERAARRAVQFTAEQLGIWHAQVARMRGLVASPKLAAAERLGMRQACQELLDSIENAEADLMEKTPEQFRSHSRVHDMRRALASLEAAVTGIIPSLERPL